MWFKHTLFALESLSLVLSICKNNVTERVVSFVLSSAILVGYAHYIMGWF